MDAITSWMKACTVCIVATTVAAAVMTVRPSHSLGASLAMGGSQSLFHSDKAATPLPPRAEVAPVGRKGENGANRSGFPFNLVVLAVFWNSLGRILKKFNRAKTAGNNSVAMPISSAHSGRHPIGSGANDPSCIVSADMGTAAHGMHTSQSSSPDGAVNACTHVRGAIAEGSAGYAKGWNDAMLVRYCEDSREIIVEVWSAARGVYSAIKEEADQREFAVARLHDLGVYTEVLDTVLAKPRTVRAVGKLPLFADVMSHLEAHHMRLERLRQRFKKLIRAEKRLVDATPHWPAESRNKEWDKDGGVESNDEVVADTFSKCFDAISQELSKTLGLLATKNKALEARHRELRAIFQSNQATAESSSEN